MNLSSDLKEADFVADRMRLTGLPQQSRASCKLTLQIMLPRTAMPSRAGELGYQARDR